MKLAWGLLTITLAAQECRLTPLSPTQPPLKVDEGERATESQTFQTAIFAGEPAEVTFAGGATGQIGGLYQVNLRLPEGLLPGPQAVVLRVANQNSNALMVWVR